MQYENASNALVNNQVQECEFERNAGGDRVAMEVNKRVENKGWICNITDVPTETNKEARIFSVLTGFYNILFSKTNRFINLMSLME